MSDVAIKIENLKKRYMLGAIGGRTLNAELQSWWARKRGKDDPNTQIGQDTSRYGETFWALDGINLEIKKGEAVGIIGANGAGKSTLLKILSRVTAPTEGDVWIDGRIASMLEVGTGFHGELTGRENIYMNGAILGMTRKEVDAKIESIIDFSECRQFIDTPVKRYSSGMYVKLAFAVASHLDAEIMVMDEVLAVGDMKFQKKCLGKMGDEAKGGKTVLYVSHNMATIRNLCTRGIVLNKGKIVFDGNVEKAIDIYSGQVAGECSVTEYHFDDLKRRTYLLGKIVKIHKLTFQKKKQTVFTDDENILLDINWSTTKSLNDLVFRIVVKNSDSSIVGMSESPIVISGEIEGNHSTKIIFPTCNLAQGHYIMVVSINSLFESGEYDMRDECPLSIPFEIVDNAFIIRKKSRWIKAYWGCVRFDDLKIEEEL